MNLAAAKRYRWFYYLSEKQYSEWWGIKSEAALSSPTI